MKRQLLFALVLVVLCSGMAFGQAKRFSVSVTVGSKSADLRSAVESYLTRELRSLGDVDVADKNGFYNIGVIVLESRVSGTLAGYVVSVVIDSRATCKAGTYEYACREYENHLIYIDNSERLRKMCEELITDFDNDVLKPLRPKAR